MVLSEDGSTMGVETTPITPPLEDVITEDAILCSIISNLRLREAVRTSVLSTRWRHLWTHIPRLHLCAQHIFDSQTVSLIENNKPLTLDEKSKLLQGKTDHFVGSVDSVIHHHQGLARIDEFLVHYFIREPHFHHLDAWIRAAVSAKTRVLDLSLKPTCQLAIPVVRYEFCCPPLGSSSLEELSLTLCSVKLPRKFNGFSHLRILILLNVDISEEDITGLLSNCCTLESLWLQMAPRIVTLSIQQPQSRLRVLGVRYCYQCREIKINATNLRELYYHGYPVNFILGDLAEMEQARITFKVENTWPRPNLVYYINKVSSNLPHLRSLSFSISDSDRKVVPDIQTKPVSFLHVTHLDWLWNTSTKITLLHLATLLDACPVLKELILHLCTKLTLEKPPQSLSKVRKELPKHPHAHLKTIQINGFYCEKWHIEFALYLIKNTIELESMTIKKKHSVLDETHIENLRQEVPATVKFAIEYFQ